MSPKTKPPKLAAKLLEYFSARYGMPEIYGDLNEVFYSRQANKIRGARSRFWLDSVRALFTLYRTSQRRRKRTPTSINLLRMIISNITTGLRHMVKRLGYSMTTIMGLALGVVACLVIFHYVRFERSYDRYHEKIDDLAIVFFDFKTNDIHSKSPAVPHFVGPKLLREFPEVSKQLRVLPGFGTRVFKAGENMFEEANYGSADSSFFNLFSHRLLLGNIHDQLKRPATILITESISKKYFGDQNPVGKTLLVNNEREYEVTGVMEDFPLNSHIRFDMLMSMTTLELSSGEEWDSPNYITYLLLAKNTDRKIFQDKINKSWLSDNQSVKLEIQSLGNLHLDTSVNNYLGKIRIIDKKYLTIFMVVAILILIIACINYINLVTARASERGREVGIRKISGATMLQLFAQFMTDSFLHILIAMIISLVIFFGSLSVTNGFLGLEMVPLTTESYTTVFLISGVILIAVTFFAGLYPSLIMTRFKPASILKGKFQSSKTALSLRKGLVIFQFSVSIALIICAAVVSAQLEYMQNKALGFDKQHTLILPADATLLDNFDAFKTEMEKIASVSRVIPVSASPTNIVIGNGAGLSENDENYVTVGSLRTNADFAEVMGLKILAGRNFDRTDRSNGDSVRLQFLVNETYLKKFGFTQEEVIGRRIWLGIAGKGEIIGIVNDFHSGSLHKKIEPILIYNKGGWINKFLVRLHAGDVQQQLAEVENEWKRFAPHRPFAFTFLDESYNSLYKTEMQINRLVHLFSGLAIIIACIGILGLASYSATQRAKEIGIRKVLGATTPGIMVLIAKDFLILVAISFALAVPLAYFLSSDWLQYFTYRISINAFHFIIAGLIAFGFAMLTIGYQTFKTSRMNPAETLKAD